MHKLLTKQLHQLALIANEPVDNAMWQALLKIVSATYQRHEYECDLPKQTTKNVSNELSQSHTKQKFEGKGQLHALLEALPDLVTLLDANGRYIELVADTPDSFSPYRQHWEGKLLIEFLSQKNLLLFSNAIAKALADNCLQIFQYTLEFDPEQRIYEGRVVPTRIEVNHVQTVLLVSRDITTEVNTLKNLEHLASHDSLTGLSNRSDFNKQLRAALTKAHKHSTKMAVFLTDLDRFKQINDSLGHQAGDKILYQSAQRLNACCTNSDIICRFGGDEFVIAIEYKDADGSLEIMAQNILKAFTEPLTIDKNSFDISTSIGIATFPKDAENAEGLMRCADNALYQAKDKGRNQFSYYTKALGDTSKAYLLLESQLRKAVANNELSLAYQPQFSIKNHSFSGIEVLLRWPNGPSKNDDPSVFIPLAELCGLIDTIGFWMIEEVLKQIVIWQKEQLNFGRVALNISGRQLNSALMPSKVQSLLHQYNISGDYLTFEITESIIIHKNSQAHKNLYLFSSMGIQLAIDDFGTGHSSLANLKLLPLSKLKIDRSFVDGLGVDANDEAITSACIAMAKSFGLEVIAEGVETQEQLAFLAQHGCDIAQGFLFSHPLEKNDIDALIRKLKH